MANYTLTVRTSPESNVPVLIDEVEVGNSPISKVLSEGKHWIEVKPPTNMIVDRWEVEKLPPAELHPIIKRIRELLPPLPAELESIVVKIIEFLPPWPLK